MQTVTVRSSVDLPNLLLSKSLGLICATVSKKLTKTATKIKQVNK